MQNENKELQQQILQNLLKLVREIVKEEIQELQKTAPSQKNNEDVILNALRTIFNDRLEGFASLKEIREHSGLCHSTVVGNINRLVLKGRLIKENDHDFDGGNLKNFFRIISMD